MKNYNKYFLIGLSAMFLLNLADIASTFWNDPTLKAEANPIFVRYQLSAFGLVVLLLGMQLLHSLLFYYHAMVFKGYDFASDKKDFSDFLKRVFGLADNQQSSPFKKVKNFFSCILNFIGMYALWSYCIGKIIVSVHNSFLAILSNNSKFITNYQTKKVDIYLNDNAIWNTFLGTLIKRYNMYDIENYDEMFAIHNLLQGVMVALVFLIYFIHLYKNYSQSPLTC